MKRKEFLLMLLFFLSVSLLTAGCKKKTSNESSDNENEVTTESDFETTNNDSTQDDATTQDDTSITIETETTANDESVISTTKNNNINNNSNKSESSTTKQNISTTVKPNTSNNTSDYTLATNSISYSRVSVHDPSIIKSGSTYYIFGSHLAFAKSTDLKKWNTFRNNINSNYTSLFKTEFEWAKKGDSVYNPSGNMWAPDVIYNKTMNKWCMYMSINGCSWNSAIALLTADSLDGNWTYKGTVIYSGFTASGVRSYTATDYTSVTGDTTLPVRYSRGEYTCKDGNTALTPTTWNEKKFPHAIDPVINYDNSGNLWMTYGSWSGGIYQIKLNNSTGLRDTSKSYSISDTSDPYFGIKLGGGNWVSGEGAYIEHIGNYYYLFVTYGGLLTNGGYNMRVYRSSSINGPFVDQKGNSALQATSHTGSVGIKLIGSSTLYGLSQVSTLIQCAQGHNSVLTDTDGKIFLVNHVRFENNNEGHEVRVHQLFVNSDGWLVSAPYEYTGETIAASYSKSDIAGTYSFVQNSPNLAWNGTTGNCAVATIVLNNNGSITGSYSGSWSVNGNQATITIANVTYKGFFLKMPNELGTHNTTMTFTVLGDNITFWGARTK